MIWNPQVFVQRRMTLAIAESCTGGLVSAAITDIPGISVVFLGGVISYSGALKHKFLNVPTSLMAAMGEVSEPVARCMADGVRLACGATWGLSVTGIAGPGGGSIHKPVGTVCFGVAGPLGIFSVQKMFGPGSRAEIRRLSTNYAFEFLDSCVNR